MEEQILILSKEILILSKEINGVLQGLNKTQDNILKILNVIDDIRKRLDKLEDK